MKPCFHKFSQIIKVLSATWSGGGGQCYLPGQVRGGTTLATVFRQPFCAQYLSDFVKTWPLGFSLVPGAARLQSWPVSKKVGGLPSWSVQLDSPATALTVGGWIRFWLAGTLLLICPSQLNQASAENDYHDNCRAQWEVQTVTHWPGWGGSKSWYQGCT